MPIRKINQMLSFFHTNSLKIYTIYIKLVTQIDGIFPFEIEQHICDWNRLSSRMKCKDSYTG